MEGKAQEFNSTIQSERDLLQKCSDLLIKYNHNAFQNLKKEDIYNPNQDFCEKLFKGKINKDYKPILKEIHDNIV